MPSRLDSPHRNHFLFSDHYLNVVLRRDPVWKSAPDLTPALEAVGQLWRRARPLVEDAPEATLEHELLQPVLDQLGHLYDHRASVMYGPKRCEPDYTLFASPEAQLQAHEALGTPEFFDSAVAVGDAKRFGTNLDRKQPGARSPMGQVAEYLYHSGRRWGFLTDGRCWRLLHRERSADMVSYYEVDLEKLLTRGDAKEFRYFWLFFRAEAFRLDEAGRCWLDEVLAGSQRYSLELGESLRQNVFEALTTLIQGFLGDPRNGLTAADLRTIQDNSLVVLYRLLFLHFAESRDLLPMENKLYHDSYGFEALRTEVERLHDQSTLPVAERIPRLWNALQQIFQAVDEGDEELDIPPYNGGLFSASEHPLVTGVCYRGPLPWRLGDRPLARVVDLLSRDRRPNGLGFNQLQRVDYRSLGVRHLGSIYEGLLELHPMVATEETPDARPGEVILLNDRGERKISGSYYTPDFIVDHLVEEALRPALERAAAAVAALRPEVDRQLARLEQQRDLAMADPEAISAQQNAQRRRLLEPYLSIDALDPAMGSGHFLVGALERLARAMGEDDNLLPLQQDGAEAEQAAYRRLVAEQCLYGVDLNPLAVELSKLSIWLASLSRDRPLSFLNHHFRVGNSLVGAFWDDLARPPRPLRKRRESQNETLDLPTSRRERSHIVAMMHEIETGPSRTRDDLLTKAAGLRSDRKSVV